LDDISVLFQRTPNLEPAFWRTGSFSGSENKHLKAFAVLSARKTPSTLDEAISLPELHLPSCGRIFPQVTQNTAHWEPGDCVSRLLCSYLHQNMQTHTLAGKSLKVTTWIHFMSTKKLIHFDPRNTPAHTGCSQGMLSIP
jgi:hypothetical protein